MFSESDVKMVDFFLTTYVRWTCFPTDMRVDISMDDNNSASSRRHGPFIVLVKFHAEAQEKNRKEDSPVTFRDIDDVLQLFNIAKFCDYVDQMISPWTWNKVSPDTTSSVSYIDLHLKIYSKGRLRTKLAKEMISMFPLWTSHLYVATL